MSLTKLKFATAEVEVAGGEKFSVRGISMQDAVILLNEFKDPIMKVVRQIQQQGDSVDLEKVAIEASIDAPGLIASLIAMASDEMTEEGIVAANKLPLPVQIDAIFKIGELTFQTEGSLKKMFETVADWLRGASLAMESLSS